MIKSLFIFCFCSLFLIQSCQNESKDTAKENNLESTEAAAKTTSEEAKPTKEEAGRESPDTPSDLDQVVVNDENTFTDDIRSTNYKKLLEGGRWVNQSDFDNRIEFIGDEFKTYRRNTVLETKSFSMDVRCTEESCLVDGKAPQFEWCFNVDGECYLVRILSKTLLKCKKAEDKDFSTYKRIQGNG